MKLIKSLYSGTFNWVKNDGIWTNLSPVTLKFLTGDYIYYSVTFDVGAKTDGLSVPKLFRWFLKTWKKNNPLYSLTGATHDALYSTEGFNGIFSRKDSDDFFRGSLRCAHENRIHASTSDVALALFASRHWGTDEYKLKNYVHLNKITAAEFYKS